MQNPQRRKSPQNHDHDPGRGTESIRSVAGLAIGRVGLVTARRGAGHAVLARRLVGADLGAHGGNAADLVVPESVASLVVPGSAVGPAAPGSAAGPAAPGDVEAGLAAGGGDEVLQEDLDPETGDEGPPVVALGPTHPRGDGRAVLEPRVAAGHDRAVTTLVTTRRWTRRSGWPGVSSGPRS